MNRNWRIKKLEEVCIIGDGNHSSKYPKKEEMISEGIPFIRANNLIEGKISEDDILYISSEKHLTLKKGHLKENDILITNRGEIGKLAIVNEKFAGSNLNSQIAWLRCKNEIYYKFLFYQLQSNLIQNHFKKNQQGAALQQFPIGLLKKVQVQLPDTPLQKRIVAILDEAFAGINQAIANTEKNLANARELFENSLNQIFDTLNPNWNQIALSNLCYIKHGFAFKSQYFSEQGDYILLTPGSFYENGGFRERGDKTKYYNGEIPSDFILKKDDFLFAMTEQAVGLLGSTLIIPEDNRFLHNQRLGLVQPYENIIWNNDFFHHQFNTARFRSSVQATASGVKVRHTSPSKLGSIKVNYPDSLSEQQTIATRLNELNTQSQNLAAIYQQKLQSLTELKQSLLQKAFTGELTANNVDKLVNP